MHLPKLLSSERGSVGGLLPLIAPPKKCSTYWDGGFGCYGKERVRRRKFCLESSKKFMR